jgi:hypothetical protein
MQDGKHDASHFTGVLPRVGFASASLDFSAFCPLYLFTLVSLYLFSSVSLFLFTSLTLHLFTSLPL